jgi:hypothetical protein
MMLFAAPRSLATFPHTDCIAVSAGHSDVTKFVVTHFVFDLLPHSYATWYAQKAHAGESRHSGQREGWLEAKFDLDPAQLKGGARRKIAQSSDDFLT